MRVFILVAALLLSGCATQVIPTSQAREVGAGAIIAKPLPDGSETVIVKRGASFAGGACSDRVFADGKPIADLRPGEKVTFKLPAGRHIIGVAKQGICPGQLREISVEMAGGQTRTFFVDVSVHAEFVFQETAM